MRASDWRAGFFLGVVSAALGGGLVSCNSPGTGASDAPPPAATATAPKPRVKEKKSAVPESEVRKPEAIRGPVEPAREAPVAAAPKKKGAVTQMDLGTLFGLQGENRAFLVDVRPPFWYAAGHLPGAINFPLKRYEAELPARKAQLDAALASGKVVVLYCANADCLDARTVAQKLAKEGLSTSVYKGGWREWKDSGLGE